MCKCVRACVRAYIMLAVCVLQFKLYVYNASNVYNASLVCSIQAVCVQCKQCVYNKSIVCTMLAVYICYLQTLMFH